MPEVPLSLVPWFDAKDNPPEEDGDPGWYRTDRGDGQCSPVWRGEWRMADERVWHNEEGARMYPQPSVWCDDPSPPDMSDPLGPLTARHLEAAAEACGVLAVLRLDHEPRFSEAAARLRRALDQIEAKS